MALVTTKEMFEKAYNGKYAIGAFNINNMEIIQGIVSACKKHNSAVILQVSKSALKYAHPLYLKKMVDAAVEETGLDIALHLDHGPDFETCKLCIESGFTSVMFDGSALPYEENVANTKIAVKLAHAKGASVEAEIGTLGKRELGLGHDDGIPTGDEPKKIYTDPKLAEAFVNETGIDALACSFGTAHGLYLTKPKLDMSVLENVKARVNIPLVMHGGSGVSEEDYRKVIARGVRKINYYTYMAKAGGTGVESKLPFKEMPIVHQGRKYKMHYLLQEEGKEIPVYYHDIVDWGMKAMKKNAYEAMKIFSNK